jgi:microsomal epoxide hydrolase
VDTRRIELTPTPIRVGDDILADLQRRLEATRWPDDAGNDDWYYGVSRGYLEELVAYWRAGYDWRRAEAEINRYEHYLVELESVPVHFMRRTGVGPNPIPLILTHGWPWTFWHWSRVVDPLADPGAHGGDPDDAFDVIAPSFPGFGFSTPSAGRPDLNFWKVADLWHTLMTGILGYERYGAAGCDKGALVTGQLGHKYADELYAIHVSAVPALDFFTGEHAWSIGRGQALPAELERKWAVHLAVQLLEPSTLAYGLSDSPVGLLAWLLQRWWRWSDHAGDVETVFTKDDLLTHAMIFWATNSIGTSMRTYANNNRYPWAPSHTRVPPIEAPTGITFVAGENPPGVTTTQRVHHFLESDEAAWCNHVNVAAHDRGGHFVPWEVPNEWVADVRRTFRVATAA